MIENYEFGKEKKGVFFTLFLLVLGGGSLSVELPMNRCYLRHCTDLPVFIQG